MAMRLRQRWLQIQRPSLTRSLQLEIRKWTHRKSSQSRYTPTPPANFDMPPLTHHMHTTGTAALGIGIPSFGIPSSCLRDHWANQFTAALPPSWDWGQAVVVR
jgi:hypothetical protein